MHAWPLNRQHPGSQQDFILEGVPSVPVTRARWYHPPRACQHSTRAAAPALTFEQQPVRPAFIRAQAHTALTYEPHARTIVRS
jgi:hypothetical protein